MPAAAAEANGGGKDGVHEMQTNVKEKESNENKPRRIFEINHIFNQEDPERSFPNNKVTTSQYTCLNFLPKQLFIQFSKVANLYFLILVFLQIIPGMAPSETGAVMTLLPLLFVVGVSMTKDFFEDRKRAKQDEAENNEICEAYPRGSLDSQMTKSLELQVGCIVKVNEN